MYQREIFRIGSPSIPTYVYVRPDETSVTYQYPYQVVVRTEDRSDALISDTRAIREQLSQIKSDISELKRQQPSPTYLDPKQDYPNGACSLCTASLTTNHQKQHLQNPVYYCDRCHNFVEERTYSAAPTSRAKTPNSTYHDSYKRPPPYSSLGRSERRKTLNELARQLLSSSAPVQHTGHWVPTAYKNTYPNRQWNLSVPHPEP